MHEFIPDIMDFGVFIEEIMFEIISEKYREKYRENFRDFMDVLNGILN